MLLFAIYAKDKDISQINALTNKEDSENKRPTKKSSEERTNARFAECSATLRGQTVLASSATKKQCQVIMMSMIDFYCKV